MIAVSNKSTGREAIVSKCIRDARLNVQPQPSHLFLVRVWLEPVGKDTNRVKVCGKVQHVATGQADYFYSCSELAKVMSRMVTLRQAGGTGKAARDGEQDDLS